MLLAAQAVERGLSLAGDLARLGGQPPHALVVVRAEPPAQALGLLVGEVGVELLGPFDPPIERGDVVGAGGCRRGHLVQVFGKAPGKLAGRTALGSSKGPLVVLFRSCHGDFPSVMASPALSGDRGTSTSSCWGHSWRPSGFSRPWPRGRRGEPRPAAGRPGAVVCRSAQARSRRWARPWFVSLSVMASPAGLGIVRMTRAAD